VVELVDTQDLKSCLQQCKCGFNSHPEYFYNPGILIRGFFMFYIYILYSESFNRYYVGQCEDIDARLKRHNNRGVPSTKPYVPWEMLYTETFATRAEATAREKGIKSKKSRKHIEYLIASK
jgi:putative endonuclease